MPNSISDHIARLSLCGMYLAVEWRVRLRRYHTKKELAQTLQETPLSLNQELMLTD